ncbi:MAG: MOSC N-terminal beta barrel domain-containing protein [Chloroflexota bacterium]
MHVSALYIYPIKSCAGISVPAATVDRGGFQHDRQFLIVDEEGVFFTQREYPKMALIQPTVNDTQLTVSVPSAEPPLKGSVAPLTIDIQTMPSDNHATRSVVIWRDRCLAVDQGDDIAHWLSAYLGTSCRLVGMADEFARKVDPDYAHSDTDQVSYADAYPYLVITEASLEHLNSRLGTPLPMNRFRPNIVVVADDTDDAAVYYPHVEDTWHTLRIGDVPFAGVKWCARCVVTTIDQEKGVQGKEPLTTLATYRNLTQPSTTNRGVMFGHNLLHLDAGTVHVGDAVHVEELKG